MNKRQKNEEINIPDVCASFQDEAVMQVVTKSMQAVRRLGFKKIVLAAILALPLSVMAQTKFGHMNSQDVITAMPEYTKAQINLLADSTATICNYLISIFYG